MQENSENRQQAQGHPCGGIIYIFLIITKHNTKVQFHNSKVSVAGCQWKNSREHQHRHGVAQPVYPLTVPCFLQMWHHSILAFTNTDIVESQEAELENTLRCPRVGQAVPQCHS